MFCTKCGSKLKENAKFCMKCGTPVKVRAESRPQINPQEQRIKGREEPQSQEISQSQESQKRQGSQEMREPLKRREPQKRQEAHKKAEAKNIKPGINVSLENKDDDKKANLRKKRTVIFLGVLIGILVIGIIITLIILIRGKADEATSTRDDTSIITEGDVGDSNNQVDEILDEESETDSGTDEADTEEASTEMETQMETEPPTEAVVLGDYTNNTEKINTYKIVISDNSWTEVYNEALQYENGYLVHINSQEEFDYIVNQITREGHENTIFWLGGMRVGNSESYNWVNAMGNSTGPELNSQNFWMSDEPSFYDYDLEVDERYMNMFFYKSSNQWVVNDAPNDLVSIIPSYSGKIGYIIEIEN